MAVYYFSHVNRQIILIIAYAQIRGCELYLNATLNTILKMKLTN